VSVDPIKKRRSRFPPEDQDQFKQWSDDIVAALAGTDDPIERFRHGQQSLFELANYFRPIVARLRQEPQDNIMSALVMAEEAGDR
jgi:cytochrome P450